MHNLILDTDDRNLIQWRFRLKKRTKSEHIDYFEINSLKLFAISALLGNKCIKMKRNVKHNYHSCTTADAFSHIYLFFYWLALA